MTRLATSLIVGLLGFTMLVAAGASAWLLVAVVTWAYGLLGGWLWVLVALGVGEVGRREMRRAR